MSQMSKALEAELDTALDVMSEVHSGLDKLMIDLTKSENHKLSVHLDWSEEDNAYLVTIPDLSDVVQPVTHGETFDEAIQNAKEVIGSFVEGRNA